MDNEPRSLFVSSSNHERLNRASLLLGELLGSSEILVLAPTHGAADDFVRACWRERGPFCGVHRLTPIQFAADLATAHLARSNLAPVSRLGIEALAARTVHLCRTEAELAYFGPVAGTPGFPRALASTLSELRTEGVTPDRLPATGAPGKDLARLLECYEKELAARSLADLATILEVATRVAKHEAHRLLDLPLVLLDLALGSTAERNFLAALVQRSPSVCATALAQDEESVTALEVLLGLKATIADGSSKAVGAEAGQTALERLRHHIFFIAPVPSGQLDASVEFFSAPGEGPECVEMARRMQSCAEAGVAFDQMAVLLRHPDAYLPLVEDALRRAGIPGFFTKGTIRPDPAGRAFLALLDCAADGLSASKFAEYLSLGQVPRVDESGAPPKPKGTWVAPESELQLSFNFLGSAEVAPLSGKEPSSGGETAGLAGETPALPDEADDSPVIEGTLRAPFAWEKLLIDAAVIGGKDRWSRRLKGLENEFRLQIERLEADDDSRREYLTKQLERLRHLQRFALPLVGCLDSLPKAAHWGEWLSALGKLAEAALRRPESVLSLLAELQPLDAVGPVTLGEVRQVVTERLSFLRREPPLRRYGRVFVGSVSEVSGRSFEIVFLPGLAEGVFPRKPSEDPLLLDAYRRTLECGLETQERRIAAERLLLRSAASAARSKLCLSYPRIDAVEGRARVPSFYALEVLRAGEGKLPPLRELEKRATEASQTRLGWPAPKNAAESIDDAEHDLAVLGQLLRATGKEVRGHARYLLSVNSHLARSLRTRAARWRKKWSGADGLVDPDDSTLRSLASQRLAARSYSASALQRFASCPYRFLLYATHRLHEREEAQSIEKLDPLTRGELFHQVQFQTLAELNRRGLLPVKEESFPQAMEVADGVLDQVAAKYKEDLAPAILLIWTNEVEDLRTDLRGWIRQMVSIHRDWLPVHFEYSFGLPLGPERDPESRPDEVVVLDGLRLRGSIDLVERNQARGLLRVTDHKTGKRPDAFPISVGEGEVLQPVLYALAVEKLLGGRVDSGVLYYCTQRGGYQSGTIPLNELARERARSVVETIDAAIRDGFMPAAPRHDACSLCDYRVVCGPYEERRVKLKPADRLDALMKVRCLP